MQRAIYSRENGHYTPHIYYIYYTHSFLYYALYLFFRPPPFGRPPEREHVWVGHGGREADAKWVEATDDKHSFL